MSEQICQLLTSLYLAYLAQFFFCPVLITQIQTLMFPASDNILTALLHIPVALQFSWKCFKDDLGPYFFSFLILQYLNLLLNTFAKKTDEVYKQY